VQFEAGATAVVTISGRNFGTNGSDVQAYLRMSSGGEAPCDERRLVSDTLIICTLLPKKGRTIEGVFVVTAGSDWSGGGQNSSTGLNSQVKEIDAPVEVIITIAKDISEIPPGSLQEAQFIAAFITDISRAIGVTPDRINVTSIHPGSVIVVFVILPDLTSTTTLSPAAAAAEIVQQASNPAVSPQSPVASPRIHASRMQESMFVSKRQINNTVCVASSHAPNKPHKARISIQPRLRNVFVNVQSLPSRPFASSDRGLDCVCDRDRDRDRGPHDVPKQHIHTRHI
jgi:hypothetical protein